MPEIIEYGEDGLTLKMIKTKSMLEEFFDELEIKADEELINNSLIFYRPSFGRAGGDDSQQFGEFDAIIAVKGKVFLIESKWYGYNDGDKGQITKRIIDPDSLRENQVDRHRVFKFYFLNWEYFSNNVSKIDQDFLKKFETETGKRGEALMTKNTTLFKNTKYIIEKIKNKFKDENMICDDVYVYFYPKKFNKEEFFPKKYGMEQHVDFKIARVGYDSNNNWQTAHIDL